MKFFTFLYFILFVPVFSSYSMEQNLNSADPFIVSNVKKVIFNKSNELGVLDSILITQVQYSDISEKDRNKADVLDYELNRYFVKGVFHLADNTYDKSSGFLYENKSYVLISDAIKKDLPINFSVYVDVKTKKNGGKSIDFNDFKSDPKLSGKVIEKIDVRGGVVRSGSDLFYKIKKESLADLEKRNSFCSSLEKKFNDVNVKMAALSDRDRKGSSFSKLKIERSNLMNSFYCEKSYGQSCTFGNGIKKRDDRIDMVQYIMFLKSSGEDIVDMCDKDLVLSK